MTNFRQLPWDTTEDAKAAHRAGWRIDHDDFYWRQRRLGDILLPEGSSYFGLTTEDLPENRVYVRSASYALAYDRGVIPPYKFNLQAESKSPPRPKSVAKPARDGDTDRDEHYKGLQSWVQDYQACRSSGNVKLAKQIKSNIDEKIREHDLDSDRVYGTDPKSEEAPSFRP